MDREKQRLTDPNEKKKKFRRKTEIWSNQDIKSNNLIENKLLEMSSNEIEGKHKEINAWLLNYSLKFVLWSCSDEIWDFVKLQAQVLQVQFHSAPLQLPGKGLDPADYYMFKVNNKDTRARCTICSELTIKTPERSHWRRSGVFIVNFERI